MKEKSKLIIKEIVFLLVLLLIPTIIGLVLYILMQNLLYWEILYIIFGLVELLVMMAKIRARDSSNYRKNKTLVEDKKTDEYKHYIRGQKVLFACAVLTILCSLIVFLFE